MVELVQAAISVELDGDDLEHLMSKGRTTVSGTMQGDRTDSQFRVRVTTPVGYDVEVVPDE